jgi:D-glycero-alpha-D-manno-heptose-7-phosphate kinase
MLFFTGTSRIASDIARSKIENIPKKERELSLIRGLVDDALAVLHNESEPLDSLGKLMDEGWQIKRSLSDRVSNPDLDAIYDAALDAGALGGKLLGAGGGGFLLIFARPEQQPKILERLKKLVYVPFDFDRSGSRVVVYEPNGL